MWSKLTSLIVKTLFIVIVFCGSSANNSCNYKRDKFSKDEVIFEGNPGSWTISRDVITRHEFKSAMQKNINAPFVTAFTDSVRLEKAMRAIDKTYTESEKELAKQELCKSPRCLTTFKAFYPGLDLLLFNIADNHYVKAAFVTASTNEVASGDERYNGDFGVLSKNGYWIGLKREDSDNYLKLELCRFVDGRFLSNTNADFTSIDIDENEPEPIFWVDDSTVYIAVKELSNIMPTDVTVYYAIRFKYEMLK